MVVNKGAIVRVTLDVAVGATVTAEELLEWVSHEFAQEGGVDIGNPLLNAESEVIAHSVKATGEYALASAWNVRKGENSTSYTAQTIRLRDHRTPEEAESWKCPSRMVRDRVAEQNGPET